MTPQADTETHLQYWYVSDQTDNAQRVFNCGRKVTQEHAVTLLALRLGHTPAAIWPFGSRTYEEVHQTPAPATRYVVVRVDKTSGDMEPVHPGTINEADARRLHSRIDRSEVWTQHAWNQYEAGIMEDLFDDDGNERDQVTYRCLRQVRRIPTNR